MITIAGQTVDLEFALIITILVGLLKTYAIPRAKMAATTYDNVVRSLAIALGILGKVADYWLSGQATSGTGLETAAKAGLLAGIASITLYHVVDGDVMASLASVLGGNPADPAPKPGPAPAPATTAVVAVGTITDAPPKIVTPGGS